MSHLSPSEFIDLADGSLPRARAAHVDGCDACRAQAARVHDALAVTGEFADVPEPSPLFWDHLSARVREGVASAPPRPMFPFGFGIVQPIAAALSVVVLVGSAVLLTRDSRTSIALPSTVTSAPAANTDPAADSALDPSHAAAWAVLTAAAADLHLDDARDAGMDVPSAVVDQAVTQLTRDELSELGRLLQSELKRSSN